MSYIGVFCDLRLSLRISIYIKTCNVLFVLCADILSVLPICLWVNEAIANETLANGALANEALAIEILANWTLANETSQWDSSRWNSSQWNSSQYHMCLIISLHLSQRLFMSMWLPLCHLLSVCAPLLIYSSPSCLEPPCGGSPLMAIWCNWNLHWLLIPETNHVSSSAMSVGRDERCNVVFGINCAEFAGFDWMNGLMCLLSTSMFSKCIFINFWQQCDMLDRQIILSLICVWLILETVYALVCYFSHGTLTNMVEYFLKLHWRARFSCEFVTVAWTSWSIWKLFQYKSLRHSKVFL